MHFKFQSISSLFTLYREVPKVTTLIPFGFSTLLLLPLSEAHYFWGVVTLGWPKPELHMGT